MRSLLVGSCLCSRVRFRATQTPLRTFACHCTFCQRLTGSAFYVESIFPHAAVEFEGEGFSTFDHTSDTSGLEVHVRFCARCGTTLGLAFERWPQVLALSRSCLHEADNIATDAHIWTRSAQAGIALPSGVDCFAESPYRLDGKIGVATRFERPIMASAAMRDDQGSLKQT